MTAQHSALFTPVRVIGFRHRIKKTAKGEARPTQVAIRTVSTGAVISLALDTETDEVDFVLGRYPTKWRKAEEGEDLSAFAKHHVVPVKKGSTDMKVPAAYEGLSTGDAVVTTLGGSGGYFALASARRGQKIGAAVYRITPGGLKDARGEDGDKDKDAELLVTLFMDGVQKFYDVRERDGAGILVTELLRSRTEAMQARIACGQRLRGQAIGSAFRQAGENVDVFKGIGNIEAEFDRLKATDAVYMALETEELRRFRELTKSVEAMDVYADIFDSVDGAGPATAARIIAAVGDVRRFQVKVDQKEIDRLRSEIHACEELAGVDTWDPNDLGLVSYEGDASAETAKAAWQEAVERKDRKRQIQIVRSNLRRAGAESEAETLDESLRLREQIGALHRKAEQRGENKFLAFCGVGLRMEDGKGVFMRRKAGARANWQPEARQGFYLLGDQWNKRPDSVWGKKLREVKAKLRATHPEPVKNEKKTLYTDGHIQRMAVWRTITLFAKWLYREWVKLEVRNSK